MCAPVRGSIELEDHDVLSLWALAAHLQMGHLMALCEVSIALRCTRSKRTRIAAGPVAAPSLPISSPSVIWNIGTSALAKQA